MNKIFQYLFRTYITPIMILVIVLPAFYMNWIKSQTSFIIILLLAGIAGQVIQYYLQQRQNKKDGIVEEKEEMDEETEKDPLASLPKEVQDLIREGEQVGKEDEVGK